MNWKLAGMLLVGLVLGFATSFVARQPEVQGQEKVKPQQCEYQLILVPGGELGDAKEFTNRFNILAADGWEYVGPAVTQPRYCLVLFKRPKK